MAEGKTEKLVVTKEIVQEFLGGIKIRSEGEIAERTERPGVAVGLAWTPSGGDVLFVEANAMKGKGGFTMTGQIGQVMQESMQAALTWVRSNARSARVWRRDFFANHDIHIHVPAGAIPKDGPSAGVTMATALVSLLTKRRITPLLAMTGEITLSGNVLPVGGIKEKVLAAKRAGVRDVILPAENRMNVEEDLTPEQLENLTVHYVKTIDEALQRFVAGSCARAGGEDPDDSSQGSEAGLQSDSDQRTGAGSRQGAHASVSHINHFEGQPHARLAFFVGPQSVTRYGFLPRRGTLDAL